MRPINTRERRSQFLIFILLFLAAICPIIVLVHSYSRVDQAENDYLRKQVALNKKVTSEAQTKFGLLEEKGEKFEELKKWLTDNSGELNSFTDDHFATVATKLADAEVTSLKFEDRVDSLLVEMISDLRASVVILNRAYESGYKAAQDLKKLDKENESLQRKLEKCPDSY